MLRNLPVGLRCSILLAAVLVMAGCAAPATGIREVETPFALNATSMRLAVRVSPPSYGIEPTLLSELLGATVAALRQTRKFRRVFALEQSVEGNPDLTLDVNIVSAREVTTWLRGFVGGYAGSGMLAAEARVTKPGSANVVAFARVAAKTSGGGIAAGTNSEAVDKFVDEIAAFMANRK